MANIRDQDSWVHQNNPGLATAKAKELVKMAVARAAVLEPLTEMPVPVNQRALVVGGGLAGLTAALTIADAGYRVYLPDLQERFGGSLAQDMRHTLEGQAIQPFLHELVTRVEMHPSRICCGEAVKNAIEIKELRPQAQVFILYRDMRTYGLKEIYYKKARDLGVRFIRFEPALKPEVAPAGDGLMVSVFDQNLKAVINLQADYLALSAAIPPHPVAKEIAGLMKLPLDADGFFMEAHLKLRPLDFAVNGIFLCGLAHSPKFLEESIAQGQGAAARALGVLAREVMYVGGAVAVVDPQKCAICLTCMRTCPYGVPRVDPAEGVVTIDPAACQGCGSCASACPRKAIEVRHHKDRQFIAKISAVDMGAEVEDRAASL